MAGALANAVLLLLIHVWPGWDVLPFLTADTPRVLGLVDATLVAGIVVGVVQLVRSEGWLTPAGSVVTTSLGIASTVWVLSVFPFDVSPGWETVVRVLLVVGIVGAAIGLLAATVSLVRMLAAAPYDGEAVDDRAARGSRR